MRLGFGLYRDMLHDDYYAFARQCGATDVIVHLCDYGVKSTAAEENADFDGVVIPDHSPQMSCSAPWHAGMAFAMGYIRSALQDLGGASA